MPAGDGVQVTVGKATQFFASSLEVALGTLKAGYLLQGMVGVSLLQAQYGYLKITLQRHHKFPMFCLVKRSLLRSHSGTSCHSEKQDKPPLVNRRWMEFTYI